MSKKKSYTLIPIPTQDGYIFLSPKKILYIEAIKNGCRIYSRQNPKPINTPYNLTEMLERINSKKFCQVHRSFIVRIPNMTGTNKTKTRIYFTNSPEVTVSESFRANFLIAAGFVAATNQQVDSAPVSTPDSAADTAIPAIKQSIPAAFA